MPATVSLSQPNYRASTHGSLQWKEYGFKLGVPEGFLLAKTTNVTLDVGINLSGWFELPLDSNLVSVVYWLQSSVKLAKPVV